VRKLKNHLLLENLKFFYNEEEHETTQLHYTEWPDRQLPKPQNDSYRHFELFINKSQEFNTSDKPIVVHCSAGIGRAGTFCIIHSHVTFMRYFVSQYKCLPEISIADSIVTMRKERMGMVQTHDQYEFCYKIIYNEFDKLERELLKDPDSLYYIDNDEIIDK